MFQARWKGHSWSFKTAAAADRWIAKLNRLFRKDEDAAYRLAYRGPLKSNPSKRSTVKRVGKALKKYVKRVLAKNPRRKYQVHVPATRNDRGYEIKVSAPTAASAKAAARKYCAKRAGVPVSKFHLPKGTKVKVI